MNLKLCILFLFWATNNSCNTNSNSKDEYINKTEQENNMMKSKTDKDEKIKVADTNNSNKPVKKPKLTPYELRQLKAAESLTSIAQFLRTYFCKSSTKSEITKVQGVPDDIVYPSKDIEVWFYGNCEITLEKGKIYTINNKENCLRYLDLSVALDYSKNDFTTSLAIEILTRN